MFQVEPFMGLCNEILKVKTVQGGSNVCKETKCMRVDTKGLRKSFASFMKL